LSMGAGAYGAASKFMTASQIFIGLGLVFFLGVIVVWLTDFQAHDKRIQTLLKEPGSDEGVSYAQIN